jgi:Ca2+-dependent lipid-binding protein
LQLQDDDDNPVWDTSFYFNMPMSASKTPAGVILLELWDNNTFKVRQQYRALAVLAAGLIC